MDLMCIMYECETPGILRTSGKPWTIEDAALAANASIDLLQELVDKGVMKRGDRTGTYYSKRILRDECSRRRKARSGSKGGTVSKPKAKAKQSRSKPEASHQAKGGSSSSTSSSISSSDINKTSDVEIPASLLQMNDFLATWEKWITHRKEIKKPLTPTSTEQQLKFLSEQQDPVATINLAIRSGWQGLFPDKNGKANENHGAVTRLPEHHLLTIRGIEGDSQRRKALKKLGYKNWESVDLNSLLGVE